MSLTIKELNHDNTTTVTPLNGNYRSEEKLYGSNSCLVSSDSEDESGYEYGGCSSSRSKGTTCTNTPAIVPMMPFKSVRNSMFFSTLPTTEQQLDTSLVSATKFFICTKKINFCLQINQPEATVKMKIETQQQESKQFQPICLKDARVKEECQSILSRFANMNEELLTLQINQSDYGKPVYSIEMTTGAHNLPPQTSSREPEYYISPDELSPLSPSNHFNASIPTMVRQFKHQSFQSESPKHVSYIRNHQSMKSATVKKSTGSPNISPSKSMFFNIFVTIY